MKPIPVHSHPIERSYSSPEAAIAGAKKHPLQPKAQEDGKRREGSLLVDGYWTDSDFVLRFSNELWLHVFVENKLARWRLAEKPPSLDESSIERVGSPPVILDWGGEIGESAMDRSTLLAKRRGAEFRMLWIHEMSFLVYTRKQLILSFGAMYRTDTGEDMLYVTEED